MIYFVRHGLSEANVKAVFAGQRDDSRLVDEGREQAQLTGKEIIKINLSIDRIVSSPATRALETAKIIAEEINFDQADIITDDRLLEYDMGILSGTPWHQVTSKELISAQEAEDIKNFQDRVSSCLHELNKLSGNTLVVSHGGVGRLLETIKEGKDAGLFYDTPIWPNAAIVPMDWIK